MVHKEIWRNTSEGQEIRLEKYVRKLEHKADLSL